MSRSVTDPVTGEPTRSGPLEAPEDIERSALLLARIRACGYVDRSVASPGMVEVARAAAAADRRLGEMVDADNRTIVVRGWLEGAAPNPDLHPSAPPKTISPVSNLVWAACLAAAWPDPALSPYPGRAFSRKSILATCTGLDADQNTVVAALDTILPAAGLIVFCGNRGALGPAAAVLPSATWSQLRRIHDRLPKITEPHQSPPNEGDPVDGSPESSTTPVRWTVTEPQAPSSEFDNTIRKIVCALEISEGPIRPADLPMLADPAVRSAVDTILARCGRTLLSLGAQGWITGYPDGVATVLAREKFGTLGSTERAVLALILLHTVAIPRAKGAHLDDSWGSKHPVQMDTLLANRKIKRTAATAALRGLRRAGFVIGAQGGGYLPGSAMLRLTSTQRNLLWEDMILLGRPNGYMAQRIREQRQATAQTHERNLESK